MTITTAILSVSASNIVGQAAADAWTQHAQALVDIGVDTDLRCGHMIGQCAHESAGFQHRIENLNYSAEGLWRVFRRHFRNRAECDRFHRQPEKIANRVYANRIGNGNEASGDGWRYRGRGFIQLTGRANYRTYGPIVGLDLEADPDLATNPDAAWRIAAAFMARTRRSGRTVLEWADADDVVMVTKCINGGTHGLTDRKIKTGRAMTALSGARSVADKQRLLLSNGFNPGPIDGLWGPKTRAAEAEAAGQFGMQGDALYDHLETLI